MLGDGRPEDGAVGVGCLLAEEHDVRALALERLREDLARGDEVGACGAGVGDEDCPVGAHRQGLAERVRRFLRPERDDDDLALGVALQPQRLLDRVRVEMVERALAGAIEPLRPRIDPGRALGDVLHADSDLHLPRAILHTGDCPPLGSVPPRDPSVTRREPLPAHHRGQSSVNGTSRPGHAELPAYRSCAELVRLPQPWTVQGLGTVRRPAAGTPGSHALAKRQDVGDEDLAHLVRAPRLDGALALVPGGEGEALVAAEGA